MPPIVFVIAIRERKCVAVKLYGPLDSIVNRAAESPFGETLSQGATATEMAVSRRFAV